MTLRVIQWTVGSVGRLALRAVIDHPELELVGGYVFSEHKVGVDLGRLVDLDDVGIAATHDAPELLGSDADCVIYTPFQPDVNELEQILESGVNVVSTAGFLAGGYIPGDFAARVDAAAKRGGVSCYGTGVNPGYLNQLCLVLASACRRVTSIQYRESADCSTYAAPDMWRVLGFGSPPDPDGGMGTQAEQLTNQFFDSIDVMAEAMGTVCDGHRSEVEYAVATDDFELPWMTFPKGTIGGQRSRWTGSVAGRDFITIEIVWKMDGPLDPDWPLSEGYDIVIEGDPSLRVNWRQDTDQTVGRGESQDYLTGALLATAMAAVNAIPAVCAAPPGLITFLDLPPTPGRYAPTLG